MSVIIIFEGQAIYFEMTHDDITLGLVDFPHHNPQPHSCISKWSVFFICTVEVTSVLCMNVLELQSWFVCSHHFCPRQAKFNKFRLLKTTTWNS
jgi:hypothetical protein